MRTRLFLALVAVSAFVSSLPAVPAAAQTPSALVEIRDLKPGALEVRGFYLPKAGEVRIQGTAIHPSLRFGSAADAWILDSDRREIVWRMADATGERRRNLRHVDQTVELAAGVYEVYYSTVPERGWTFSDDGDDEWWEGLVREVVGWEDYREDVAELSLTVLGTGQPAREGDLSRARRTVSDAALLSLVGLLDSSFNGQGFRLDREADVTLYAVGELTKDGGYDYAWIVDLDRGQRVWTFTWDGSQPGGGAKKNRVERRTLHLPAGRYAAVALTDDSHSPAKWNAPPPQDPVFWGLTLTAEPAVRAATSLFAWSPLPTGEALAAVAGVGSGARESTAFTLTAPAEVRVWALGEGGDGKLFDYGWIVDRKSRQKVWEMDYRRTDHGGGARKNRLADERVRLAPGTYELVFVTDDSHAFRDWNASPPFAPERWGLSLFPVDAGFDRAALRPAVEAAAGTGAVLARLLEVGDDAHEKVLFDLDRPARVTVRAVGEGSGGEMHDYGWIEDAKNGRVVWEMTYRMTDPAGGAEKNRAFEGTLQLDPGRYVVHFKTDGSHSYRHWNADPPGDPEAWGIEVARVEGG